MLGLWLSAGPSWAATAQPLAATYWKYVWGDEFEGASLDRSRWNVTPRDQPNYDGGWNYYDASEVFLQDGRLVIRSQGHKRPGQRRRFSSGRVTTRGKFEFLYGKVEIRAMLPGGKGLWPALWLLPRDGSWPPEVDVMELIGNDRRRVFMTQHYGSRRHPHQDQDSFRGPDFTSDFHTFTLEWLPGLLRWRVDGIERKVVTTNVPDRAMYLIMNTSVGGDWPGAVDDTTTFPQLMQIDYVRVYQLRRVR